MIESRAATFIERPGNEASVIINVSLVRLGENKMLFMYSPSRHMGMNKPFYFL
jgi:hypothetical protein